MSAHLLEAAILRHFINVYLLQLLVYLSFALICPIKVKYIISFDEMIFKEQRKQSLWLLFPFGMDYIVQNHFQAHYVLHYFNVPEVN